MMITSPIKTVLKNNSNKRYTFKINLEQSVTLLKNGSGQDRAIIYGDVFSLFLESRGYEPLMHAVMSGDITVSYKIEPFFDVAIEEHVLHTSTNVMAGLYRRWSESKRRVPEVKDVEPANVKEAEKIIAESVVDIATEPVVVAEPPANEEPVGVVENADAVADSVADPVVNKVEESTVSIEDEQPKKKSRRVKLS